MGRKRRESGYSQSNRRARSLRPNIPLQGGVDHLQPNHITQSAFAQPPQQHTWGPSAEHRAFVPFNAWPTPAVADASNADSLDVLTGHNVSLAQTATAENGLNHENGRTISPVVNTPSGSTASLHDYDHGQQIGPAVRTFEHMHPSSMTEYEITGIDNRDPENIANSFPTQPRPRFIVPPHTHTTHFQANVHNAPPWDPIRPLNISVSTMDVTMHDVSNTLGGPSGRERIGGRRGPLSPEQKQQAGDVRRVRACLRCMVTREKCDLGIPCNSCNSKDRRKFPQHCIRKTFSWEDRLLHYFPEELTGHLQTKRVFTEITESTFQVLPSPILQVRLNLYINKKITVKVREFHPLGPPTRSAHRMVRDANGNKTYQRLDVWDPPIIMLVPLGKLKEVMERTRQALLQCFAEELVSEDTWVTWTMKWYRDEVTEDFQCDILGWIYKYYRKDIPEHGIIRQALCLIWLVSLLVNKFMVDRADAAILEESMHFKRTEAQKNLDAIPDKINRFLKGLILPMAIACAKLVTEALHNQLFKMASSASFGVAETDIVMCLLFVLMMFVGEQQATVLLLADVPDEESNLSFDLEMAKQKVLKMEQDVVDLWISFHRYTLSRGPTTEATGNTPVSASPSSSSMHSLEGASAAEIHAREFKLVQEIRKVQDEYGMCMPPNLDLVSLLLSKNQQQRRCSQADRKLFSVQHRPSDLDLGGAATNHGFVLDGFRALNVARLCWKVWANVAEVNGP
ncbi:hypothetical protein PV10_02284 [Exophiala mesophila]|uniref:Zn(2)-C6 fungal-type domain-containing protein n=1 Tax=Exophiala mesophila TaxID=212818 RepID=A0A0D1ZKW1_EXOME|nr:uncharacterized protein PV10_02284 [Exophiala mesophila]KIV94524.1 hypothetical protein PV10_02284 [Exophiala mesophila]